MYFSVFYCYFVTFLLYLCDLKAIKSQNHVTLRIKNKTMASKSKKEPVRLRERILKDGSISLYLDIL